MATIGIDLGTYNSAAGYMLPDGTVALLQSSYGPTFHGGYVTPSFVKFLANGEFEQYGELARKEIKTAPHLVVWGVKRLLGQTYQKAKEKKELDRFRYPIEEAPNKSIQIPIAPGKIYTPVEITKILLEKIKADCESPLNPVGRTITKAVITHPAYFDDPQIRAVKDAAMGAGFEEIKLLKEPEAAALAYKNILGFESDQWTMVIDWGAGTLDMVIAKFHLDNGIPKITSMSLPYGDNRLGGIDMDDALLEEAKRLYHLDDMNSKEEGNLRMEIEYGKIELSNKPLLKDQYFLYKGENINLKMARNIECIPHDEDKEKWIILEDVLERDEKNDGKKERGILKKFKERLIFALREVEPSGIDQLILVGGPMNMPCVKKVIKDVFKDNERGVLQQLERIEKDGFPVSPLEAVVKGATIYSSPDRGGITTSIEDAFGYGFLIHRMYGEILILPRMHGDIEKQTKYPLSANISPGERIPLSLIKQEITLEGEKYYRRGDYNFTLVIGPMGTSCTPILKKDKNLITLKIKDNNSPNEPLTLSLSSHEDIETGKPIPIPPPPPGGDKPPPPGPIPAEKVEKLRKEAESAIGFIESEQRRGKTLSNETMEKAAKLKQALADLPSGPIPPEFQFRYQAVDNACQGVNAALVNNGYTEEELRL